MTQQVTAKMVKQLRDKTSSGMMDCRNALLECGCDVEKAIDWLRQKGLMTARKREGRSTKEGLIVAAISGDMKRASIVEMNCETDFVAKNESFQKLADDIAKLLLESSTTCNTVEELLEKTGSDGKTKIGANITDLVGTIGENMNLRRFQVLTADANSFLHTYIHGEGRIGVVINMSTENINNESQELAHDIALQVAAIKPMVLKIEDVPADFLEREKAVYKQVAADSGKPANILEKIVEGNIKKLFTEIVLLEQSFVKDSSKNIKTVLKDSSTSLGKTSIVEYARFQLGEEVAGETQDDE